MIFNCDLTSAFEDGGLGGMVVAVLMGVWMWWQKHGKKTESPAQNKAR